MEQISQLLSGEYYDKEEFLSGQKNMIENATKAFVDGLGDPYTSYLDAEQFSGLQTELEGEGQIEGIWAVVGKKDYYIQVEEVVKDSPAFKAGVLPLDRIIMIGTGETKDLSTMEAVQKIRGPKGTKVQLFLERVEKTGDKSYLEKVVERGILMFLLWDQKFWIKAEFCLDISRCLFLETKPIGSLLEQFQSCLKLK